MPLQTPYPFGVKTFKVLHLLLQTHSSALSQNLFPN